MKLTIESSVYFIICKMCYTSSISAHLYCMYIHMRVCVCTFIFPRKLLVKHLLAPCVLPLQCNCGHYRSQRSTLTCPGLPCEKKNILSSKTEKTCMHNTYYKSVETLLCSVFNVNKLLCCEYGESMFLLDHSK